MAFETIYIQAEDGTPGTDNSAGTQVRDPNNLETGGTLRPDHSGDGYVDFGDASGDTFQYTFEDDDPGARTVHVRYASKGPRPLDVFVNGTNLATSPTKFVDTDRDGSGGQEAFDFWSVVTFDFTSQSGTNTIDLTIPGNAPNVDAIAVSEQGASVSFFDPEITSAATFDVLENTTAVGTVVADDIDREAVTFALKDGGDAGLFAIDANTGALTFLSAPDFESDPTSYSLTVEATDGLATVEQQITVNVTDDITDNLSTPEIAPIIVQAEALPITGTSTLNSTQLLSLEADNVDGGDQYNLRSGYSGTGYTDYGSQPGDAITWTVNVDEAGAYDLHIKFATNSPRPLDLVAGNTSQTVTFTGDDFGVWQTTVVTVDLEAGDNTVSLAIPAGRSNGPNIDALALSSVDGEVVFPGPNVAPEFPLDVVSDAEVAENTTAVGTFAASDADGDAVQYTLSGADAELFQIDSAGALSFKAAPDFEARADANLDNTYDVTVEASDGTLSAQTDVAVSVTNDPSDDVVVDNPPTAADITDATTDEDTAVVIDLADAIDDGEGAEPQITEATSTEGTVTFVGTVLTFTPAQNFNGPASIAYTVADAGGQTAGGTVTVAVNPVNDAPTLSGEPLAQTVTTEGGSVDLSALTAADVDGDDTTLAVRLAGGGDLPQGVAIENGAIVLPAGLAAGTLELEVVANDGTADSESAVLVAVTIEEAVPSFTIQAEDATQVTVTDVGGPGTGPVNRAVTQVVGPGETDAFGNDRENAVGDGFVDFGEDPGDKIDIAFNATVAGTYNFVISYAMGSDDARVLALAVNGTSAGNVSFGNSGGWDTYADLAVEVALAAGPNTVTLEIPTAANGGTGNGPNIDQVTFALKEASPVDAEPTELTVSAIDVTENVSGAEVATVVVADVDTTYDAGDLTLSDPSGQFELVGTATANTFTLKLKDQEALDAEAASQTTVTVSLGALSRDFTPAPLNDASDDVVVDNPPTAADITGATTDEDTAVVIDLADAIDDGEGAEPQITEAISTEGTVTIDGTVLTFTPAQNFNGAASIAYTVADAGGQTAGGAVTVTVNPVNDAPTLSGEPLAQTVTTEGGSVDLATLTAADVEGDDTTLAVRLADGSDLPEGVAIENGAIVLPAGLAAGTLELEVVANDGTADSESAVRVTVTIEEAVAVDRSYAVPTEGELVIQLENRDGSIVINDDTGTGEGDVKSTQFRDASNTESIQTGRDDGLWNGYTGSGYLDMGGDVGDQATFDVNVEAAGEYTFAFRYNNGSTFNDGTRPLAIAVDSAVQATPNFANNGLAWTDWQTETVTLTLPEGTSTISITNTVANGPNLDQVTITPPAPVVDAEPTELTVSAIDVTENVSGAEVATVVVADVDTTYDAGDLTLSDPSGQFELVGTATANTFTLKLKDQEALDAEAASQTTVTVSLGGLSADFTAAPLNDPSDDPVDNPPTAADITGATTDEDTAVVIDLADAIDDGEGAEPQITEAISTEGTVTIDGTVLTFTPAQNFNGAASIAYTVADAGGQTAGGAVTVTVNPVNDAPTLSGEPLAQTVTTEGGSVDLSALTAADVDGDDTTLAVRVKGGGDLPEGVAIENGAIVLPAGLAAGTLDLEVVANDGTVDSDPIEVTVTVQEPAVVVPSLDVDFSGGAIAAYSANQDKPGNYGTGANVLEGGSKLELDGNLWKKVALGSTYDITANTTLEVTIETPGAAPEMILVGFDLDNDPFDGDKSLYQLGGTQRFNPAIELTNGVANGDGTTTFKINLSAHAGKSIDALVFVNDDDLKSNGESATLFSNVRLTDGGVAENTAPRVVGGGVADFGVLENGTLEIDLPFVDDQGDALTFTVSVRDADGADVTQNFNFSVEDGVLSSSSIGLSKGLYTVTVEASDGELTTSDSFALDVRQVNAAPVVADTAFEPIFGKVGEPITPVSLDDFTGAFSDPNGDELTFTVTGLAPGLELVEGTIVGTPTGPGGDSFTIIATDPLGETAALTIGLLIDAPEVGDVTFVEAENFTGLAAANKFFATGQSGASGDQLIRVNGNQFGEVETNLAQNGVNEGWYELAIDIYDETDGSATFSLKVGETQLATNLSFDSDGTFLNGDGVTGRGGAGQKGNIKRIAFDEAVYIDASTKLTYSGQADGELLRTDRLVLTRVDAPVDNQAPGVTTIDVASVAENAIGAIVGTLSATDPDGDAVTFTTDDARFEVVNGQLKLKDGIALDFETETSVDVEVVADDGEGGLTPTILTIAVTDVTEAPGAATLDNVAIDENAPGAVVGTLSSVAPNGQPVTFSVDAASDFEIVDGTTLKLKDGVALNHEAAETVTVTVTASDGATDVPADLVITVADVNDAPTLGDGVSLDDASVLAGAGGTVDLSVLGASDEDAGDVVEYAVRTGANATLPAGISVVGTDLDVDASTPAGVYEVEVFATDGELDSESVSLTVTVEDEVVAPFVPFAVQAEDGVITLAQAVDGNQTQVRDADNPETGGSIALRPDFSGTGYVDYGNDAGDTLTLTINVPAAGQYDLNVRYASNSARPLDLAVNGASAGQFAFAATDPDGNGGVEGFDNWAFETQALTLNAGDNTISFAIPSGANTGPNLDRIEITEVGTGPIPAADLTADEGDDLAATSPTVGNDALTAVEFTLSGVDADIQKVEASIDGGEFALVDATNGVVTLDLSAFASETSVAVTFRVTDGATNTATTDATVTIEEDVVQPFAQTIQLEARDGSITIIDDTGSGEGDTQSTQFRDSANPESDNNGGKVDGLWPGFNGSGYLDMGTDIGDAYSFEVDVPAAGDYTFEFRFNQGSTSTSTRPMVLSVDGSQAATLQFPSNLDWTVWQTESATVTLAAGVNIITMTNTVTNGPNFDQVTITSAGATPDTSADADEFPLTLGGDTGELTRTQAASINFNVSGDDADVVKIEISFDGGTTRIDVTDIVDADGDFVVDGSGLAAGPQTATIIVTDAVGNEATSDLSFSIAATETGQPIVIQAEDETLVTVLDTGTGNLDTSLTREVNAQNPDAFGNYRAGAVGEAYVDFGTDPGDAISVSVNAPAAGTYEVTFRYANGGNATRPLEVSVDGGAASNVDFAPTGDGDAGWVNWTDLTIELDLTAGQNTVNLAIPTAANGGVANGPNIDQITFTAKEGGDTGGGGGNGDAEVFESVIKVNFEAPKSGNGNFNAPASYTTPAGFEADTGEAYGDRGNGFTYGWVDIDDANNTVTQTPKAQPTGSMRYKNSVTEASDLQKTYAHFDYPGTADGDRERAWEIALEDGTYEVTVAIGDTAGQYDSNYVLNVEGQQFGPAYEPVNLAGEKLVGGAYNASFDGEGFRSNLYTGVVQVSDGRLTIDGTDGENVEIQWLDIDRVPDLTPNDDRSADLDYSKFVSAVAASTEDGQVSIEIDENGDVPLNIDPTSSIVVGVQLQAIDHRGPAVTAVDGVKLYETLTGVEVPINVQITGGADSLTIRPLQELKEFTSYTLNIEDVLDLGNLNDSSLPQRQFQDYTTTFVTGEAPEVVAKDVAFIDQVVLNGFGDGGSAFTSIEFGPDGKLYVSTILGEIKRWDVNSDGTLDKASVETLSLDYFQDGGRSIIGLAFDPSDPNTLWVTDNAPVPREGKADSTPDFSGQISKITLGDGGSFAGAEAETYIAGLPRSGGDHVTNSLEFRANPDAGQAGEPDYLLYLTQGSNSAAGRPDNAWGFRPERLLNAAALEVDPRREAPEGGFDVQTEPYDPSVNIPTFRTGEDFNANGTFDGFFNPFADDAVLKIYGQGIRNAYDLVWHSNGYLYTPTNGTARGGNTLDDPNTPINEQLSNLDKQFDYIFQVQEGGYYGHPNSLLGNYVVNGGAGGTPNIYGSDNSANTSDAGNEYPSGVLPDADYDIDGSYSLGFNKSPNGAIEYTGDKFGTSLKGALLFAQFSVGDNVRVINVDPITGRITGDDVLRRPGGDEIDEYIDPLDIIENPLTGQLYLMTLNRGNGESKIVLLNPAPGGAVGDNTADEGNDLNLLVVDATDPANVVFEVQGLDQDITSLQASFGATTETVTLDDQNRFALDMSGATGSVSVTLRVSDGANFATDAVAVSLPGGGGGSTSTFIDALAFTLLDTDSGTIIRNINDTSTHEPTDGNDANGDGLNDGYDGDGYVDPNGGAEDKVSFQYVAPADGTYEFSFRMASNSARGVTIKTGGQSETINVNTGTFTTWQDFKVTLTLTTGDNTIVIAQSTAQGPNIDSVTITPLDIAADETADEGGDLALSVTDATDTAAVKFAVAGLDADIVTTTVSFDGGATATPVTIVGGEFTADLSGLSGSVTATLTVQDGVPNTATAGTTFTLDAGGVTNDGTETADGLLFVKYEAENASLTGAPDEITTGEDDRGQSGGSFIDFLGPDSETIEWTIEVAEDGNYRVDILYALATGKDARPLALTVDGVPSGTLPFVANSNGDETVWGPQSTTLALTAGVHTIAVTAPAGVGPNVDYLRVTSEPVVADTFEPAYAAIDGEGRIELEATDDTTRTVDADTVEFYFTVAADGLYALDVAANAGAPNGGGLTFLLAANGGAPVQIEDGAFPGVGEAGETTAYIALQAGVQYKLTVNSDQPGANALDYLDVRAAPGDPNADIGIESQDPAYYDNRLHFSWLDNNSGSADNRDFKENAFVEISNTGSSTLEFFDADVTGPFELADPAVFDGLTLGAGQSVTVEVLFDRSQYNSGPNSASGVFEGAIVLRTNDADTPVATVDLAGFWQARDEGGWEPNLNEVWEVFGFGTRVDGLPQVDSQANSPLNNRDIVEAVNEQEVLSSYWKLADGVSEAKITQIAAYHGDGGANLFIHAPGNKGQNVNFGSHAGDNNQSLLPVKGNGNFQTATFTNATIPDGWAGNDIFGIGQANFSTDATLNTQDGPGTVPDGVQRGHFVRMFQALDAEGNVIPNVYLGVQDYTGINYDYNDNMFVIEGVTPVGNGGTFAISGLDDAAADDRLVFSRIEQPNNKGGLPQNFRDEATITITNDGIGALTIDAVNIAGDFQIVGTPPVNVTVATGASVDVTVRYVGADGVDDNKAVAHSGSLSVETSAGTKTVALAGLAQIQSEAGEEPTVAQIVEAFGYSTDVAQGELANGGQVETVGDEVLLPYLQRLDGSKPVEIVQLAAYLQQGNIARLNSHDPSSAALTELFAADDQQGQTLLPDGLVPGAGDTGSVARGIINSDAPFGLKVTVDGRPTFAAWTDPDVNVADEAFNLSSTNEGHYIRFFQAIDGNGEVIEGRYIGIQDYPGGENFDYNDHMFVVTNVKAADFSALDADDNGINDALENDADTDGTVDFFDGDFTPPSVQAPFNPTGTPWQVDADGLSLAANQFDSGGNGIAWNDNPGRDNTGQALRADTDVELVGAQQDIGYVKPGEWLEYTVDVPAAGSYLISVNGKTPVAGAGVAVSVEGGPVLGSITIPDSNGAGTDFGGTTFAETDAVAVTLAGGVQTLRLTFTGSNLATNGYLLDLRSLSIAPQPAVTNNPPTTTGIAGAPEGDVDDAYAFDVASFFSDVDGDTLTYTAAQLPSGLSISPTGVISGTPTVAGSFEVTVTASDGEASVDSAFTLVIEEPVATNNPPTTTGIAGAPEGDVDDAYAFNVASFFSDVDGDTLTYTAAQLPAGLSISSTGVISGTPTVAGSFEVTVTASDGEASVDSAFTLVVTPDDPLPNGQTPFPGPNAPIVTGGALTVKASNFDDGGQGVAYNDQAGLQGGTNGGRAGVDVEHTKDNDIGWVQDGEWLEYTINVAQAGSYKLDFLSSLARTTGPQRTVTASFADGDGVYESASTVVTNTGTWSNFTNFTAGTVDLEAGLQVVRVTFNGGPQDFRSFTLTQEAVANPQSPFPGPNAPVLNGTLVVDATNFDNGGQGVAYNDDPGFDGQANNSRPGTDVELVGAEKDIGYVEAGEWVEYTIDVAKAGVYDLTVNAKTPIAGNTIAVSLDGGLKLGDVVLADTNGPGTSFAGTSFGPSAPIRVTLPEGEQVLRFTFEGQPASNGYLLDMRSFTLKEAPVVTDPTDAIGLAGSETFTQTDADTWFTVEFDQALDDPSVVMGPIQTTGDPATMRVRNVTDEGFEFQLDEWDYLDGAHQEVTVSWLAVEAGVHTLENGLKIEAGSTTGGTAFKSVGLSGGFASAPVVLGQATSDNGPEAITTRLANVTSSSFRFLLQEEEAGNLQHAPEDFDWIAVSTGVGDGLVAGLTGKNVNHNAKSFSFGQDLGTDPLLFAQMQTRDGGDTTTVGLLGKTATGATIKLQEEQSKDDELNHTTENIGWFALSDDGSFLV